MSNESISEELNSGLVAGVATHDGKECEGIPDSENKKKNKRKKKKKKKVETSDNDPHGCDAKAENTGPLPKSFENDQGEDGNELHSSNKGTPIEEGEEVVPAPREASGGKKRKKKKKKKSKESETSMDYEEDPNANNSLKQQTEEQDDTSPKDGSGVAKDDKRYFVETKREEQEDEDSSQSRAEDNASPSERIESKEKKVETSDNDPHGCDAKAENTGPLPKSFENDQGEDGNELHSSNKGTPIEEGEEVVPAPREASGGKKRKKKKKKKSKESETSMVYVEDLKPNNSLKQHTEKQDDTSPMDGSGVAKDDKRHFVETKRNEQGDEDNSQSLAEDNASLSERIESKDQDDDTASSIGEKTTSVPVPYKESEICTPKDGDEKGEAESERTMKPSSRASEELHVDGLAPLRDPSSVAVQVGGEGEEEIEDRGEKEEEEEKVESDSHGDPSDFPSGNEE